LTYFRVYGDIVEKLFMVWIAENIKNHCNKLTSLTETESDAADA